MDCLQRVRDAVIVCLFGSHIMYGFALKLRIDQEEDDSVKGILLGFIDFRSCENYVSFIFMYGM